MALFFLTAPSLPQHIPSRRSAAIRIPFVRPRRSEQRITGVVGSENYLLSHGCGVGWTVFLRPAKNKAKPRKTLRSVSQRCSSQFTLQPSPNKEYLLRSAQTARERTSACTAKLKECLESRKLWTPRCAEQQNQERILRAGWERSVLTPSPVMPPPLPFPHQAITYLE